MSIRGARSSRRHPATEGTLGSIDLQFAEGRIYYIITSVIFAFFASLFCAVLFLLYTLIISVFILAQNN